jgi:hypothetical protein
MQSIDETKRLVVPFPVSQPTSQQQRRYKTFYEENKHSFDDGMSRNIDRDSGFDLARYEKNQKIFKFIAFVVIALIIVLVCIL